MNEYLKIKLINRNFIHRKNEILRITGAIFVSVFVIISALLMININEKNIVEENYSKYGRHAINVILNENIDYMKLKNEEEIEDILPYTKNEIYTDDFIYNNYYSNSKIFSFMNAYLLEGKFPQNENEVAVDKSYLFKLGIPEKEMIGSRIQVQISDDGESREYIVTGLTGKNDLVQTSLEQPNVNLFFVENSERPRELFLELSDICKYKTVMDKVVEKYSLDREKCYVNYDLFVSMGFESPMNVFERDRNLLNFFYGLVYLSTIIIIYNNCKKMIINNLKSIKIMNVIGIPMNLVIKSLLITIMGIVLSGIILSSLSFTIIGAIVLGIKDRSFENLSWFLNTFDYKTFFYSLIMYLILILLLQYPLIASFRRYLSDNFSCSRIKIRNRLKKKSNNYINTLANINLSGSKGTSCISIFSLAIITAVFVTGLYFLNVNNKSLGNPTDMDYKITYNNESSNLENENTKTYQKLLEFSEDCYIFPNYVSIENIILNRENINENYLSYLEKSAEYSMQIDNKWRKQLELPIIILGYSEQQILNLYKLNGIQSDEKLKSGEVILLNKTIPFCGEEGFDIDFKRNESLKVKCYLDGIDSFQNFKVKEVVENLELYPDNMYNQICAIVSEKSFQKMFHKETPSEVYIKVLSDLSSVRESIQSAMIGDEMLSISFPKQEEEEFLKGNQAAKAIITIVFFIILIVIVISISSSMYLRIYVNEVKYALLYTIGLSFSEQKKIFRYEIVKIFFWSQFLAIPLSYISTKFLRTTILGESGKYSYHFPSDIYMVGILFVILFIVLSLRPNFKYLKTVNNIKVLKEKE